MEYVQIEKRDRIGFITLNRAEKRNALNAAFVEELAAKFKDLEDDNQIKVVILRANGVVFSAGADLKYLQDLQANSYDENVEDSRRLMQLYLQIYQSELIVIAEVGGHAIAGGCGLITVCDFVFTVDEAKFGYTEVKIGFIPAIVMVFLLRKLSETHAKEILLSGYLIKAEKAREIGLVNKIIDKKQIQVFTENFAKDLLKMNSAASMSMTKTMIAQVQDMPLEQALELAVERNATVRGSDDCKRGIEAFLNGEQIFW
jgi:methylglutaconyl-CoA hydratase